MEKRFTMNNKSLNGMGFNVHRMSAEEADAKLGKRADGKPHRLVNELTFRCDDATLDGLRKLVDQYACSCLDVFMQRLGRGSLLVARRREVMNAFRSELDAWIDQKQLLDCEAEEDAELEDLARETEDSRPRLRPDEW